MKIISPRIHGLLDYFEGVILVGAPWLFGFAAGGAETWIPVLLGLVVLAYSLFTDYPFSLSSQISMRTHLNLDILAGLFLMASPWLFQFSEDVFVPHLVLGLVAFGAAVMTKPVSERSSDQQHRHAH